MTAATISKPQPPSAPDTPATSFLSLPPELRNRIYTYLYTTSPHQTSTPLLTAKTRTIHLSRTCTLLRSETRLLENAHATHFYTTTTFTLDLLTTTSSTHDPSTRAFKRTLTAYCDTLAAAPIQKIEILFLTQQVFASVAAIAKVWVNGRGKAVYEVVERGGEREEWDDEEEEDGGVIVRERVEESLGVRWGKKEGGGGRLDAGTVARWVLRTLMPIAFDEKVAEV